ncbi:MAG: ABC transporter permease [Thaumarchaeota archaeon]|nr:ABC transporter permease [Nitrososphaerota archaeon]
MSSEKPSQTAKRDSSQVSDFRDALFAHLKRSVPQVVALALGLAVSAVLVIAFGFNPVTLFGGVIYYALATPSGQSSVLTYAGIYTLTALAFLIPGRAGIWNVGANGQIYFGGIAAAIVVTFVPLPPLIWPLAAVAVAILAGAAWGFVPGALEAYRNASAIVTTIMLNYVANAITSLLIFTVVALKFRSISLTNFATIPTDAMIPTLPYFTTSIMVVLAVLIAGGTMYFLYRTTLGYNIRATGLGKDPAEAKGINPRTTQVIAMMIGGGLAGLVGAGDVLGAGHACGPGACVFIEWVEGWFGGEGFAGIAVALVAANNPVGAVFSAFFFAILVAGGSTIPGTGEYLFWAIQAIIIIFMAAPYLSTLLRRWSGRKWT